MNISHAASSTAQPVYRLIGRPESGYSVKVRSAMRFKGVAVEWLDRFAHSKLYQQHAKVQLIPLVLLPTGAPMQDSTPILEYLEAEHPEPSLHPANPALRFLSVLMEDYGDEWANKLMFHYRWGYRADQERRGTSLAAGVLDGKGLGVFKPVLLPFFKGCSRSQIGPRDMRALEIVRIFEDPGVAKPFQETSETRDGDHIWIEPRSERPRATTHAAGVA